MISDIHDYSNGQKAMVNAGIYSTKQVGFVGILQFDKPMTKELRDKIANSPCGYILRQSDSYSNLGEDLCPVGGQRIAWGLYDKDAEGSWGRRDGDSVGAQDAALIDLIMTLKGEGLKLRGQVELYSGSDEATLKYDASDDTISAYIEDRQLFEVGIEAIVQDYEAMYKNSVYNTEFPMIVSFREKNCIPEPVAGVDDGILADRDFGDE